MIFLTATVGLAPRLKLAPPALSVLPQAYPIAWKTSAQILAPQILNAPPPHLIAKTAYVRQPNLVLLIPIVPVELLIV